MLHTFILNYLNNLIYIPTVNRSYNLMVFYSLFILDIMRVCSDYIAIQTPAQENDKLTIQAGKYMLYKELTGISMSDARAKVSLKPMSL
jgi:hypothetical protein